MWSGRDWGMWMIICPFLIHWGIGELEVPTDNLSMPDLYGQAVWPVCKITRWDRWGKLFCWTGNCLARKHDSTQRNFSKKPNDGVVWPRVCGSLGNNEMLAHWNMRNHPNITAAFTLCIQYGRCSRAYSGCTFIFCLIRKCGANCLKIWT